MPYLPFYFAYFMTLSMKGDVRVGSRGFLTYTFTDVFYLITFPLICSEEEKVMLKNVIVMLTLNV